MDDEQSFSNKSPDSDAAAEAFAHLEARIAGMEERMDRRIEMLTRAVEHVAIEKQSVEIPDYSATLARMGGALATLAGQAKTIAEAPAMQLTPETMAERMREAAEQARETDRITIKKAHDLHRETHADLTCTIGAIRTTKEQYRRIAYAISGAILVISLLWLIYPGWAAGIGPQGWLWPERVARRTLGEATLWDAGIRLMRTGNPEAWNAIVDATDMRRDNRETINACEKAAAEAEKPVRCTIMIAISRREASSF